MTEVAQGQSVTLTVQWSEYNGGPATNVTAQTITIKKVSDNSVVVGPTSSGITNLATGLYSYAWSVSPTQDAGDYLAIWNATDAQSEAVQASEVVEVVAASELQLYNNLTNLKAFITETGTTYDTELTNCLTAASRRIDEDTGRRFWADEVASARQYTPKHPTLLLVDDIATTDGLVVEVGRGSSWSTVDASLYDTLPYNALVDGYAIEALERVGGFWPYGTSTRVRVTAKWGCATVPGQIAYACMLLAARLFRRKDSPEGVKGFTDLGVIRLSAYDPDYLGAIAPYVKKVL